MSFNYDGLEFRTRLVARWAAFFDLAQWTWHTNAAPIGDWTPDFLVSFPCGHSECRDEHRLLVSVLPVDNIDSVAGHPALQHRYSVEDHTGRSRADAGAIFGASPLVSKWEMAHGAGGGISAVPEWVINHHELWVLAGGFVNAQEP
ncbi:hypothetical protein [Burkholderia cenocepacia]|uniref:hypothetical protein n=1 Tax=Burkholderia cenocepacia TaxID=95486 RepID=UPI001B97AE3D|nr:hypothetical protein [Burkholderia cenocepacia]MBR8426219.1 hypothetical protein [Burkholderia cenocepacia]